MNLTDWKDTEILITGGTGSLGKALISLLLKKYKPKGIRIFSRDELKQWELSQQLGDLPNVSFLIGDVRDYQRVYMAMQRVDIVIHAAAMKQVPACEYNPIEAIKTNINGTINIIESAIHQKVKKVMFISTDKAVSPINLYGMTKGVAEKLIIHSNVYSGELVPHFSCCRYGNVMNSRGSLLTMLKNDKINLTDKRMTRFWIGLDQASQFVLDCIEEMRGGEIFIPKIPTMNIEDMIKTVSPEAEIKTIGIRKGEKIHECLIAKEESKNVVIKKDKFIITQEEQWGNDEWDYTSDDKTNILDIKKIIN